MGSDDDGARDHYQEFLQRTKAPEARNDDEDPHSWRRFWLSVVLFLAAASTIVMFFKSDTTQAVSERRAWLSSCGVGEECGATSEEWHRLCFYMRADGESHFDKLAKLNRRAVMRRREYDPDEYRRCMDGHARDYLTSQRVDAMLREKEAAVRRHESKAE